VWVELAKNLTALTYTDLTARPGVVEQYEVRAHTGSTTSSSGVVLGVANLSTPQVTAIGKTNSVELTWTAIVGADYYGIWRLNLATGKLTQLETNWLGTTYTDTDARIGIEENYVIRAYGEPIPGNLLVSREGSTKGSAIFGSPQVTATGQVDSVELKWTAVVGATSYSVWRRIPSGIWTKLTDLSSTTLEFTDTDVTVGIVTEYYVYAYKGTMRSEWDPALVVIVIAQPLGAPQVVATGQPGGVKLTWAAISYADRYEVYRKVPGGSWTKLTDLSSAILEFTDTGATAGVTTDYYVYAYKGPTRSEWNPALVVTGTAQPLGTPQVTATGQPGGVKLTWAAISYADRYEVWRKVPGGNWTKLANLSSTTLEFMDTGPTVGVVTDYYVYAYRGTMRSEWNPALVVIGTAQPGAPQVTAIGQPGGVKLNWAAISYYVDRYEVWCRVPGGSWTNLADLSSATLEFTDTGATVGIATEYYVYAYKETTRSEWNPALVVVGTAQPIAQPLPDNLLALTFYLDDAEIDELFFKAC
jgi:hypothetical protein